MKKPNLKRNFIYSLFNQAVTIGTVFITAPYFSRVLQPSGIGIQSYTASVQMYFSLVAALGTSVYGERTISQNRDQPNIYSRLFWEIEFMTVITSMICIIAWTALIACSKDYRVYFIILTLNILATMFDITWFFSGLEQFGIIVARNSVFKLLGIMLMFMAVKSPNDLWVYITISSCSALLSSISLWLYLPKFLVKTDFKNMNLMPHFKQTLVYFMPTIATSVYTVLDKTLIGLITKDEVQNGCYEQAEKVISVLKSIVFVALNTVTGTRASYLAANNRYDEIKQKIKESLHYVFFMGAGCVCGIIGIADSFVPLFFGAGYDRVVYLLYILAPIVIIIGISNCLGSQYYTPAGRRSETARYIAYGAIINFLLNLILISYIGAYGAAISSVIAETVISFLYVYRSSGFIKIIEIAQIGKKKIVAGIIMIVVIRIIRFCLHSVVNDVIILILQIAAGAAAYITILLVLHDRWVINRMPNNIKKHKVK